MSFEEHQDQVSQRGLPTDAFPMQISQKLIMVSKRVAIRIGEVEVGLERVL